MRLMLVVIAGLILGAAGALPAAAHDRYGPLVGDGVTARIVGGVGSAVWTRGAAEDYEVLVTVYQKVGGAWRQVAMQATLRVFVFNPATLQDEDRASIPFTSSASSAVAVSISGSAVGPPNFGDVFVTFSQLGPHPVTGKVPTSHHSLAKNVLLSAGYYEAADRLDLDFHGATRPLFV